MKLMKHIMIALVLCAIPAMAFGQVNCEDCSHVASVYMGEGGVIATAGDDVEMVNWLASCGGVTRTGMLTPNDDGVVAALFEGDLACHADGGGSFEIGPVMDGGWFWITGDRSSAVGGLVDKAVYMALMDDTVDITSAGEGVEMTMGKGAVLLHEMASGRLGILPNILPEAPMEATPKCGFNTGGTAAAPTYSRKMTGCELGDQGNIILATTTNGFTGATERILDKGMVYRPAGAGSSQILIDLWGNMSGFFTTAASDSDATTFADDPRLGNPAAAMTAARANLRMGHATADAVNYTVTVGGGAGPGGGTEATVGGAAVAGVTRVAPTGEGNNNNATIVNVAADPAYCSADGKNNYSANVKVDVAITAAGAGEITPPLKRNATSGAVGSLNFTVICQSGAASANPGVELVPENPFPVN